MTVNFGTESNSGVETGSSTIESGMKNKPENVHGFSLTSLFYFICISIFFSVSVQQIQMFPSSIQVFLPVPVFICTVTVAAP